MPANEMLNEFANANNDELAVRMTELFDVALDGPDESAIETLKSELETILQEKINALDEN